MSIITPKDLQLRLVRDAGEPLGLFFRPGRSDHPVLSQLLAEDCIGMLGAVFDPSHNDFQKELRTDIVRRNIDAILDPGLMELAATGGFKSRQQLPWAGPRPHVPSDFDSAKCELIAEQIAAYVASNGFTVVLAPTHYLHNGFKDEWLDVDKRLVINLRKHLDAHNCGEVPIYYPLALSISVFLNATQRIMLKGALSGLPIDALWLRIQSFGSQSGNTTLGHYIKACQSLHALHLPLVAEKTGVLGLALLAFGAVSGIESGISTGEKFDYVRLTRPLKAPKSFGKSARIYLPDLGTFLSRKQAETFFKSRGLSHFACRDQNCCRRGLENMLGSGARRHFTYHRMGEVDQLSQIPPSLRPNLYMNNILKPVTDHIARALATPELPDVIKKKLQKNRERFDGWQATLGKMSHHQIVSHSATIERRIVRMQATA